MTDIATCPEQVIPLEPVARKFAERYSLLTHLVVAGSLLQEAIPAIKSDPGDFSFAWIEALTASALILAAIRELKRKKGDHHGTVAWTEIFAGLVLVVEAAIKWRAGSRHYPLAIARTLVAMLVIGLGVSHARLKYARSLRLDDKGLRWRRRLLLRYSADWKDIRGLSIDERAAVFTLAEGKNLSLAIGRMKHKEELRDAIVSAAMRHGVDVSDTRQLR